jgi:hypothetical protein
LFAVANAKEAADAVEQIRADYPHHSRRAREIACEYFDPDVVLRRFLTEMGLDRLPN